MGSWIEGAKDFGSDLTTFRPIEGAYAWGDVFGSAGGSLVNGAASGASDDIWNGPQGGLDGDASYDPEGQNNTGWTTRGLLIAVAVGAVLYVGMPVLMAMSSGD